MGALICVSRQHTFRSEVRSRRTIVRRAIVLICTAQTNCSINVESVSFGRQFENHLAADVGPFWPVP